MSRQPRRAQGNADLNWSIVKGGATATTAASSLSSSSYPTLATSGGLYDLDTLNEDLVTAQRPSPSAFHDITEPKMDSLRALNKNKAAFKDMIRAADADVANHAARMRKLNESEGGGAGKDASSWREREERRRKWDAKADALKKEAPTILRLADTPIEGTQAEVTKERMARWQRALELYVTVQKKRGMRGGREEMLEALSQASQVCTNLLDQTSLASRDATDAMTEAEDAYHIRLEAHTMLADRVSEQAEKIEEQFRTNGRAALKIGQQLELAEAKKRQCDTASLLIRQWWMMENLAEQEELSGEELQVNEEVRGVIPSSSCRMDPLFTRPENSLEAAKALKALRTVVKSRGNSASGTLLDPMSRHRFDVTSKLIQRTSVALESRLLNSFSEIYVTGGTYDFSSPDAASRPGRLNWIQLRNLAMALSNFDGGRGLHKRYVQMVVSSRFPELHHGKSGNDDSDSDEDDDHLDMDSMRQKLPTYFIASMKFARTLLQRVISDPRDGLQARINDLLESIDRRGDFDAGTKKLDTFVVIHEKAAGLFTMLKDRHKPCSWPTTKEMSLSSSHRRGYLNLELRLLHHECCYCLDRTGAKLVIPKRGKDNGRHNQSMGQAGGPATYEAPVMPLDKHHLKKIGFSGLLNGVLKSSVLRQPLMHATDSLARARLMFGMGQGFGDMDSTARVITGIFSQMCTFYGNSFLFPIIEVLGDLLDTKPPAAPPNLPFDENSPAPDLGVDGSFWVGIERIHSAAKAFDRELWAEQRKGSERVWEILEATGLFGQAGKVQALVFMSRRVDYRVKVGNVIQKSAWVVELLEDLGVLTYRW
ncbi:exocyst complex component 5 [Skeletonema marinoi]|uniref:Exocyst complex component 5 n=1 Tax=Skeletonema marinoi TaxID=267567 RepID=A0AAD8YFC6_9STRA|nr:exocyst complex component 5 [Skeletonema marinoi]